MLVLVIKTHASDLYSKRFTHWSISQLKFLFVIWRWSYGRSQQDMEENKKTEVRFVINDK